MVLIRFVVFLLVIAVGASLVVYLFTRDPRYLRFTWQVFKFGVVFLLVALALFVLERLVLVV